MDFTLQYGHITHIDLKVPPRPPGYAFVEVSWKLHRLLCKFPFFALIKINPNRGLIFAV